MASETEIEQVDYLLSLATYDGIIKVLQSYKQNLVKAVPAEKSIEPPKSTVVSSTASDTTDGGSQDSLKAQNLKRPLDTNIPPSLPDLGLTYVPIEQFAWDQSNDSAPGKAKVSIYIELPGVGNAKERVTCEFGTQNFDLKIIDLNGKNYRLVKDNLEKDIVPNESKFIVKKDSIVLKLQKAKGEYSYADHWPRLIATKPRAEKDSKAKDPGANLMEMMKEMYDDGDENMKKVIGEAMLKSQREKGMM